MTDRDAFLLYAVTAAAVALVAVTGTALPGWVGVALFVGAITAEVLREVATPRGEA